VGAPGTVTRGAAARSATATAAAAAAAAAAADAAAAVSHAGACGDGGDRRGGGDSAFDSGGGGGGGAGSVADRADGAEGSRPPPTPPPMSPQTRGAARSAAQPSDPHAPAAVGDPAIAAGGGHPDPHDQAADPPQGGAGGSISVVLGRGPLTGVRGGDGGNASGVGGDAAATSPEPPPNDIEWVTVVDNLNNQPDIHDYGPRYQNFERRWWRHIHALWPGFPPPDNSAVTQIRRTPAARTAARTAWQRRNPERHKWAVKVNNTFYFKCVR